MSESASVEVLSAEVRVLKVGNGQITRSMYRQLDEATLDRFEPFGRVKDNKRKTKEGVLQLVGRDSKTAALVRYIAQPSNWSSSRDPLNSSTGSSTPGNRHPTQLPTARTDAAWSGPGRRLLAPRCTAGMSVRTDHQ
jgi:hypothetical protein